MNTKLYNEMKDIKEVLRKYLDRKSKEFEEVQLKLKGMSDSISVDNVKNLGILSELSVNLESISADYLRAKSALKTISTILHSVKETPDKATEAFEKFKVTLRELGIIECPVTVNDNVSMLSNRI